MADKKNGAPAPDPEKTKSFMRKVVEAGVHLGAPGAVGFASGAAEAKYGPYGAHAVNATVGIASVAGFLATDDGLVFEASKMGLHTVGSSTGRSAGYKFTDKLIKKWEERRRREAVADLRKDLAGEANEDLAKALREGAQRAPLPEQVTTTKQKENGVEVAVPAKK